MKTPLSEKLTITIISILLIQSLFFKFSGSPETQFIFATVDAWASQYLIAGLFVDGGPFNAYITGTIELIAAVSMLASLVIGNLRLRLLGAGIALAVISGAIFFHIVTPLGIEVQGDGGTLFIMALVVWFGAAFIIIKNKSVLLNRMA
jgi:hypothetical protein